MIYRKHFFVKADSRQRKPELKLFCPFCMSVRALMRHIASVVPFIVDYDYIIKFIHHNIYELYINLPKN